MIFIISKEKLKDCYRFWINHVHFTTGYIHGRAREPVAEKIDAEKDIVENGV